MPTHYDSLPDIAVGRHPDYGIVATSPKQLDASTWMLKVLDFHPVPDQPTLYTLANQLQDGQGRATRAVALLRRAGYQIDVDAAFDPSLASNTAPARERPHTDPDVAFAEHPQLGIVAATSDHSSSPDGRIILEDHGWRLNPDLNIYTLPVASDRSVALERVASATVSIHRSDLQVAVEPCLAQDVATRRRPAPARASHRERNQGSTTAKYPMSSAALAASPARTGLPGKAPVQRQDATPAAVRPVDPRIAFSRPR
ncbi:hypothetical protein [Streptomyces sp. NBC_00385]|uniref:hypothetical protein n=1 Tax=Streptomyces sp. NBC_00385 TaxID=2975733 RepID=UPI002DD899C3|nr:hypothetical protein [Streptomyces sp. NBC_00385]WRZ03614.1 hypothetical protein OG959_09775 [Streptomyces sp. NBC_00385]